MKIRTCYSSIKKVGLILSLSFFLCQLSLADVDQENAQLARINNVLNAVYPLIDAAQAQALPNEKVQFHYAWLRADIASIQAGIAQKINQAPIMPVMVAPLHHRFINGHTPVFLYNDNSTDRVNK